MDWRTKYWIIFSSILVILIIYGIIEMDYEDTACEKALANQICGEELKEGSLSYIFSLDDTTFTCMQGHREVKERYKFTPNEISQCPMIQRGFFKNEN